MKLLEYTEIDRDGDGIPYEKGRVSINPKHVAAIFETGGHADIYMTGADGAYISVNASYDTVTKDMANVLDPVATAIRAKA